MASLSAFEPSLRRRRRAWNPLRVPVPFLMFAVSHTVIGGLVHWPVSLVGQTSDTLALYRDDPGVVQITDADVKLRDADAEFYRIAAIVPRGDGDFVVANSGTSELRLFDSAGVLKWSVGRRGGGPEEYGYIAWVGVLSGDSLAVFDGLSRQVSIIGPEGDFIRSFLLAAPFEGGGSPTGLEALGDGTLLVGFLEVRSMEPQPEAVYLWQRLFRYSSTGELLATAPLRLPASEHFVQTVAPSLGGVAYWDLAFGRRTSIRAHGGSIFNGDGTNWTIEQRTSDGVVVMTHLLHRDLDPVTGADRRDYAIGLLERSNATQRARMQRMAAEMPYPAVKPAYRRFELDDRGDVWIEAYSPLGDGGTRWIRLNRRQRRATEFRLPARFRALAFQKDMIFGISRDGDDVEHVRVYSIAAAVRRD